VASTSRTIWSGSTNAAAQIPIEVGAPATSQYVIWIHCALIAE
jgi:hypothetical protein